MAYGNLFSATLLDGESSASVELPDEAALDGTVPFTLQALVRDDGSGSDACIVRRGDALNLRYEGDGLLFFRAGMGTFVGSMQDGQFVAGGWNDVCVTYDGSMVRLFVNGVLALASSCARAGAACSEPLVVGEGMTGAVRWVRTFSRALSADEVAGLMTCGYDEVRAGFAGALLTSFVDLTLSEPVERIGAARVALGPGASVRKLAPGLRLVGGACVAISNEPECNPAGGGNDAYTVQAWVMLDPIEGRDVYTVFANGDPTGEAGMSLYVASVGGAWRLKALRGDEPPLVADACNIEPRVWTNVCVTYDGLATQRLYVDGALAAESSSSFPMREILESPLPRVGAEPELSTDNGRDAFEGVMGRVDVWNRCLDDADVATFVSSAPAPDAVGLVFSCDFSSGATDNLVSSNPVGLRSGAAIDLAGLDAGEAVAGDSARSCGTPAAPTSVACGLSSEEIAAERRRVLALSGMRDLPFAEHAGADAGAELRTRVEKRRCPCVASSVRREGATYFLLHCHDASYVVETLEGDIDPELEWWIEFLLTLIAGVVSLLIGVTPSGSSLASLIRTNPTIVIRLRSFLSGAVTAKSIIGMLYALKGAGVLIDMVKATLRGVSWFKVILAVSRVALLAVALCTGASVVYYAAMLTDLVVSLGVLIARYPSHATEPGVALACVSMRFDPSDKAGYQAGDVASSADLAGANFEPVKVPEWTPKVSAPALYALSEVTGKSIVLKADFFAETAEVAVSGATVRARDVSPTPLLGSSGELALSFIDRRADGVLVRFPSHAMTSVGARDVELSWERRTQDGWKRFALSKHRIYVTLSMPRQIWGSNEPVWTNVLDLACSWATGATTLDAVAKTVTERVNGEIGFVYDTERGAPRYMLWNERGPYGYLLRNLLNDISCGKNPVVNCSDCAGAVSLISSALGCPVGTIIMAEPNGLGFTYVPIRPVGQNVWKSGAFSFHHVAYETDGSGLQGNVHTLVFDACCTLNGSDNPASSTGRAPVLPVKMPFSLLEDGAALPVKSLPRGSYREHFATNDEGGIGSCVLFGADGPVTPSKRVAPLSDAAGASLVAGASGSGAAGARRAEEILQEIRAARSSRGKRATVSGAAVGSLPAMPLELASWRAVERAALDGLRGSCCTRYVGPEGVEALVSVRVCSAPNAADALLAEMLARCSAVFDGFGDIGVSGALGEVCAGGSTYVAFVRSNVLVEVMLVALGTGGESSGRGGVGIDGLARAVDDALLAVYDRKRS